MSSTRQSLIFDVVYSGYRQFQEKFIHFPAPSQETPCVTARVGADLKIGHYTPLTAERSKTKEKNKCQHKPTQTSSRCSSRRCATKCPCSTSATTSYSPGSSSAGTWRKFPASRC